MKCSMGRTCSNVCSRVTACAYCCYVHGGVTGSTLLRSSAMRQMTMGGTLRPPQARLRRPD
eukprot:4148433-Amphidinium_carterae.1